MEHEQTNPSRETTRSTPPQPATPEYVRLLSLTREGQTGDLDALLTGVEGGIPTLQPVTGTELIVFLCGSAPCAAPLGALREVLPALPQYAPLPSSPLWMLGVFGLRAEMLGLVDPSPVLLGMPSTDLYEPILGRPGWPAVRPPAMPGARRIELAMVIVAGEGERSLGLAVSAVGDLAVAQEDEIIRDPSVFTRAASPIAERYIAGIYTPRDTTDHYTILTVERLVDDLIVALEREAEYRG